MKNLKNTLVKAFSLILIAAFMVCNVNNISAEAKTMLPAENVAGWFDWADDLIDQAEDAIEYVVDKTKDVVEDVVEKTEEVVENVVDKTEEVVEDGSTYSFAITNENGESINDATITVTYSGIFSQSSSTVSADNGIGTIKASEGLKALTEVTISAEGYESQTYSADDFWQFIELTWSLNKQDKLINNNDSINITLTANAPTTTPEPTAEPTPTPEPTAEPTPTPEPTAEPSATPEPTAEPSATPEPTAEPSATPEPTAEPSTTPEPTVVPTAAPESDIEEEITEPDEIEISEDTVEEEILDIEEIETPEGAAEEEEVLELDEIDVPEGAVEEEVLELDEIDVPEGAAEEEEILELDEIETPQGDVLPQTGTTPNSLLFAIGAACIVFGGFVVINSKRKEADAE